MGSSWGEDPHSERNVIFEKQLGQFSGFYVGFIVSFLLCLI